MSSQYQQSVLSYSPLIYTRYGESSGSTATDISGHNNHGTLSTQGVTMGVPGALSASLDNDTAYQFDGSHGYVSYPNTFDFANYDAFSVVIWFNLPTLNLGSDVRIIANGHPDQNPQGIQIAISNGGNGGFFGVGFGTNDATSYFSNVHFQTNKWYMLACTYTLTTRSYYIFDSSTSIHQNTDTHASHRVASSGYPVNVARNPVYNGDYFPGFADEFAVFGQALNLTQLTNLYTAATVPPYIPTVSYTLAGVDGTAILKGL